MVAIGTQSSLAPGVRWAISVFLSPSVKLKPRLFDRIIRRLAGDHDVVHVALAQAGSADAHEARLLLQLGNRGAAAVAHADLRPPTIWWTIIADRSAIGHAAFNAFGHQLVQAVAIAVAARSAAEEALRPVLWK